MTDTNAVPQIAGRTLRYTASSLIKAQKELDDQPLYGTLTSLGSVSPRHVVVMAWAGMLHATPELTIDEAAELVEPPLIESVSAILAALKPWIAFKREVSA
jgi:hypothetical protein